MKEKIFPQANNLETVINIFRYISNNGPVSKEDIANIFNFDLRQADYYLSANEYLGLIDSNYCITKLGYEILSSEKIIENFFKVVLSDKIISDIFLTYILGITVDLKKYCSFTIKKYYPQYSDAVINRRASTIINWIKYIINFLKIRQNNF